MSSHAPDSTAPTKFNNHAEPPSRRRPTRPASLNSWVAILLAETGTLAGASSPPKPGPAASPPPSSSAPSPGSSPPYAPHASHPHKPSGPSSPRGACRSGRQRTIGSDAAPASRCCAPVPSPIGRNEAEPCFRRSVARDGRANTRGLRSAQVSRAGGLRDVLLANLVSYGGRSAPITRPGPRFRALQGSGFSRAPSIAAGGK
jgi:hypothetical protein